MKNQSRRISKGLLFVGSLLALAACSSSPSKSDSNPTPATQEVIPAKPIQGATDGKVGGGTVGASIFAGDAADSVKIATSEKKLTPVQVPTEGTHGVDLGGESSGPAITLKPDPLNAKAGKNRAESKMEASPVPAAKPAVVGVEPATSLRWLKNGNTRFAKGWFRKDGQAIKDVKRLVTAHRPHAVVLASSDARIPPELVFDQKLGEIFTIRTLGPSLSAEVLGSIEYAIMNLGTRNIVVLGHSSCGGAKIAYITMDGQIAGSENLKAVVSDIQPRIRPLLEGGKQPSKNFMAECWANTKGVASDLLARSSVIKEAVDGGQVQINSSLYDLETGKVEFR